MKPRKPVRRTALELAQLQAESNRSVIESLRKMQQEMRVIADRTHAIERRQERLALTFLRAAADVGGSDPAADMIGGAR